MTKRQNKSAKKDVVQKITLLKASKKQTPMIAILFIAIVAISFGVIRYHGLPSFARNVKIDGIYIPKPIDINNFQLTDNSGKSFTKENLKGHWTMLFFGFTNCGMVCPSTMAELKKMYVGLQKDLPNGELPQVVMVSVDPERDTVDRMNSYVASFNPHFIGAVGDEDQTDALKKQLHIVSGKLKLDGPWGNKYTINHSAEIMLFNPDAKLQAYLSYPHKADQMISDYKSILANTTS